MIYHKHNMKKETYKTKNSGEILTENQGYLTVEQQVRQMIEAGQQLASYRAEAYQYTFDGKKISDVDYSDLILSKKGDFERLFNVKKELNRKYIDKYNELSQRKQEVSINEQLKNSENKTTVKSEPAIETS